MKLDLRKDYQTIFKHIKQRVRDYPKYLNLGPGLDDDPVSQITLGYQFLQAGWVTLVFDTRPKSEPDGEWNSYIEENWLEMEHWFDAIDELVENETPIKITLHDGSKITVDEETDESELAALLGTMLRDVLIAARDEGEWAKLPLAKRCIMGVEEQDGYYGWPEYEKRLKEGRVS